MFFIMVALTFSLLIVIFSLQNSVIVPIHFFAWSTDVPLVLIIFISAFAGAVIIFSLALWKDMKRKFKSVSTKASDKATEFKSKASDYKEKSWLNKVKPVKDNGDDKSSQQKTSPEKPQTPESSDKTASAATVDTSTATSVADSAKTEDSKTTLSQAKSDKKEDL